MRETILEIEKKYNALRERLYDPEISNDQQEMVKVSKEISSMENLYATIMKYKGVYLQKKEAEDLLNTETDEEMIELAKQQLRDAEHDLPQLEADLKVALLPKDPLDDKNIFLEIRPAAGGDEAGLFGTELMRMYLAYAQKKGFKTEIVDHQLSDIGGLKFAMIKISGDSVYSQLKYESGVHRVQRIPATESNGRVHTSTVTVAIMPEVENTEFELNPNDIQMDTYAASSAGGQNANKNQTGVRLHHKPTGTIVTIGDSKSQMQNKEKAFQVLKARLYQIELDKAQQAERETRGSQIGGGDRSEKIRTYNFPQDRLTDHRIKQSRSNLPAIMMGEMDDIVNDLIVADQAAKMEAAKEQ